ncbi:hypothetical protein ACLQ84_23720 [Bordetella bronchiseptica]|uniref:hypothetical protein n=1 Tax=Bordetella bronchiseptica TaxID=518 RepID=UPI0037D1DE22
MTYFDEYDQDHDQEPRAVTCKRCGTTGLRWEDDGGEWVLMEGRYKVHRCDMRKAALNDFEAVR